jgi:hypothetical protein
LSLSEVENGNCEQQREKKKFCTHFFVSRKSV